MERHLRRAVLLAVVALFAMGCSTARVGPPRIEPAVLVPVDENGNLHGSAGPWAFFFDLDDETVRPSSAEVATTAAEIAAYMKAHRDIRLRIDGKGAPPGTDAQTLAVRQRRIAAIRDALVDAGVPAAKISLGVAPNPPVGR